MGDQSPDNEERKKEDTEVIAIKTDPTIWTIDWGWDGGWGVLKKTTKKQQQNIKRERDRDRQTDTERAKEPNRKADVF